MIRLLKEPSKQIAFISSYLPRKCGIATFTSDLISNLRLAGNKEFRPLVFAMDSAGDIKYGQPVEFVIRKDVQSDYALVAEYINLSDIQAVSVQHEFGLFGGLGGSYINILLKKLQKPVITTLHTILKKPSKEYFDSMVDVCQASTNIIVMNERGVGMLRDIYDVPEDKIMLIPHGMPDLSFTESASYKQRLGLSGRKTILTFGLLSSNKGIEVMLKALPEIVHFDSSVLYIVLGATHPEVLRNEGDSYKLKLEKIVNDLNLQDNVIFHNHFVTDEQLFEFLGASDIYVTPYLHEEQLTSGTLAFAVGAGKAVVSTPYWAAAELLAKGRGRLVRFNDPAHTAEAVLGILKSRSLFDGMRRRAYRYARARTWPKAGQAYWNLFDGLESPNSVSESLTANSRISKVPVYNR